jgi:hypothetical protein
MSSLLCGCYNIHNLSTMHGKKQSLLMLRDVVRIEINAV